MAGARSRVWVAGHGGWMAALSCGVAARHTATACALSRRLAHAQHVHALLDLGVRRSDDNARHEACGAASERAQRHSRVVGVSPKRAGARSASLRREQITTKHRLSVCVLRALPRDAWGVRSDASQLFRPPRRSTDNVRGPPLTPHKTDAPATSPGPYTTAGRRMTSGSPGTARSASSLQAAGARSSTGVVCGGGRARVSALHASRRQSRR